MKHLSIAAIAFALVATACGSDDDTTEQEPATTASDVTTASEVTPPDTAPASTADAVADADAYVEAAAASLSFDDDDIAQCIGQAAVDGVGYDEIVATGLTPDELFAQSLGESGLTIPEERVSSTKDAVAGCGDLVGLYIDQGATSDAERNCAEEYLTNELVGEIFVTTLGNVAPSDELQTASDAMDACLMENG